MFRKFCVAYIAMATCVLFAQDQRSTYESAVGDYAAGHYDRSCAEFRQLSETSNKLQDLNRSVLQNEKSSMMRGFDWQKKAFESDNLHQWAKECAEWYHSAVRNRADEDMMLVNNALEYAQRAEKHVLDERQSGEPTPRQVFSAGQSRTSPGTPAATGDAGIRGCASDDAMQKSVKLVFPCLDLLLQQARTAKQAGKTVQARAAYERVLQVNGYAGFQRSFDVDKEARDYLNQAAATKAAPAIKAGAGSIPSGTYKCYAATTATVLAGGSARLNPGNWGGNIEIKGDTYLYGSNPWGHYTVGTNGKITWTGGAYSSATLGRYIVDNGAPTIVIGWADTDAGQICKQ